MSEDRMLELCQEDLAKRGIDDQLVAAGQFNPRGHTGGLFVGGLVGDSAGGLLGGAGSAVGTAIGSLEGMRVSDEASGLPDTMLVGVSATKVYGFAAKTRRAEPTALAFQVPREGLTAKVHQRVNVRILELIEDGGESRIELEGNRIPLTHSKDVIEALSS